MEEREKCRYMEGNREGKSAGIWKGIGRGKGRSVEGNGEGKRAGIWREQGMERAGIWKGIGRGKGQVLYKKVNRERPWAGTCK